MSYSMQKNVNSDNIVGESVELEQDLGSLINSEYIVRRIVTIATTSPLITQETSASDADFRSL